MVAKLAKMLLKHDSMQINESMDESFTPTVIQDSDNLPTGFDIPEPSGQSLVELQNEVAPDYMRACLKMANRAMTNQVNVFKEGDLPHKMALMLAHKMFPNRKVGEKVQAATPRKNKKTAQALKQLITSLSLEAEEADVSFSDVEPTVSADIQGQTEVGYSAVAGAGR